MPRGAPEAAPSGTRRGLLRSAASINHHENQGVTRGEKPSNLPSLNGANPTTLSPSPTADNVTDRQIDGQALALYI